MFENIIGIILAIVLGTFFWVKWYPNGLIARLLIRKRQKASMPEIERTTQNVPNYDIAYQRKYLLTRREYPEFLHLREIAENKGLIVCPKVRLLDIIEPRRNAGREYTTLLRKVQSKHVDFVICDKAMHILAIIELDDSTHDRPDRQERDRFVDTILGSVGYKVIHTRNITQNILGDM